MGLAFPALIVLLILLPGVLLNYAYRRGFFRKTPVTLGPIRNEIGPGIVWALALHATFLPFLSWGFGWLPDPQLVLGLVHEGGNLVPKPASGRAVVVQLFWYLIGTNALALIAGWLAHGFVRWWKLDLRYDWLRFGNEWFYIFSGEARIFQQPQPDRDVSSIHEFLSSDDVDLVFVSVVVEQGDRPVLYWGVLADYFFDPDGMLEKIILQEAQRRNLSGDAKKDVSQRIPTVDDRFYPIRGNFLTIRYQDVLNLNVEYLRIPEETTEEADSEADESTSEGEAKTVTWSRDMSTFFQSVVS